MFIKALSCPETLANRGSGWLALTSVCPAHPAPRREDEPSQLLADIGSCNCGVSSCEMRRVGVWGQKEDTHVGGSGHAELSGSMPERGRDKTQ